MSFVWTIAEQYQGTLKNVSFELLSRGRTLADKLETKLASVVIGDGVSEESMMELIRRGADEVYSIQDPRLAEFVVETYSNVLAGIIKTYAPVIILAAATSAGRTLMPHLAIKVNTGLTADCTELDIEERTGNLLQTRPAIGGNIMATIKTPEHRPQMATVRPKTFKIPDPVRRSGEIIEFKCTEDLKKTAVEPLEFRKLPGNEENIQELDVIVSGGKGLKRKESFKMLERLAKLLDGAVGASRPTIEAKWMDYPHQVGLSGKVVSPKLYFAIGISGAIQHIAGMETSGLIVAVNKDKNAPIFEFSDYGFCGDLFDILPKLISRIEEKKNADGDQHV